MSLWPVLTPAGSAWQKLGLLAALYLAQGLPFGFFTQALPVILRRDGYSLAEIGLSSLLALPWALKFLWAPLVDRHFILGLGRRRSWILPLQALTFVVLGLAAAAPPSRGLQLLLATVFVVNLLAATQDIATDALAVDLLKPEERGLANGVQVAGYRLGMIIGGGALLYLLDQLGWVMVFGVMAGLVGLCTVPVLMLREDAAVPAPPAPLAPVSPGTAIDVHGGRAPGGHFLGRPEAMGILIVLCSFKFGDALGTGMLRPFLVDLGLGLTDIGILLGTVGFLAGLLGALAGGALVNPLGRRNALLLFGGLQSATLFAYGLLATSPVLAREPALMYSLCALEHFAGGMATASLFTWMMDRSRPESAATDYTVQASAVVLATGGAQALSGFSAQAIGYSLHFAGSAGLSLLALGAVLIFVEPERQGGR